MNLLIAVPTFENICPETFKSIFNLIRPDIFQRVAFEFVKGYDCARARNEIAKKAIEGEFDYVLMVDSDVILPNDTLLSFFAKKDAPMPELMLGTIPKKNTTEHKTDMFSFNNENFGDANRYGLQELDQMLERGINKIIIKGGAFGCALIKVSVFKELPYPWFQYLVYENGNVLSEDLYFCSLLSENHFDTVLDLKVRCGHLIRRFQYE